MLKRLLNLLLSGSDDEYIPSHEVTISPFPGTWAHLFVKRVGSTVYVYLDNTLIGTGLLNSGQLSMDSDNRIGYSHFNNNILQGEIKLLHFYNYDLDDTEREAIYDSEV